MLHYLSLSLALSRSLSPLLKIEIRKALSHESICGMASPRVFHFPTTIIINAIAYQISTTSIRQQCAAYPWPHGSFLWHSPQVKPWHSNNNKHLVCPSKMNASPLHRLPKRPALSDKRWSESARRRAHSIKAWSNTHIAWDLTCGGLNSALPAEATRRGMDVWMSGWPATRITRILHAQQHPVRQTKL